MKIIFLILPVLIGAIVGFYLHDPIAQKINPPKKIAASPLVNGFDSTNELRVNLNSVYRENVILLTSGLRRIYNREPYAPDVIEALAENTSDIADIIGTFYGQNIKSEYLNLWNKQNLAYISFTEAVRDKNISKKAQAENDLADYKDVSISFWTRVNPNFDGGSYRQIIADRISFIKNFVNDLDAGNITASYKEQHSAYQQNGKVADFLTNNIARQFPEKFK